MTDRKTRAVLITKVVLTALIMVVGSRLPAWAWLQLVMPAFACWIMWAVWDE